VRRGQGRIDAEKKASVNRGFLNGAWFGRHGGFLHGI
jgi:hypothetical protein